LRRIASSRLGGGHATVADLAGQAISMTFRGTSVTWVTVHGADQGKAAVFVDGVLKGTYDDYTAKSSYNVKHTVSHLPDKVHTVKIVVLGKHHKGAKGNVVTVDRFTVG
jgi:bacillopeptidase F